MTIRQLSDASKTIGIIGTYPPRMCGLATFTADVASSLRAAGDVPVIVALVDDDEPVSNEVAHRLLRRSSTAARAMAATLSAEVDVVLIEHEFGIFGGRDGAMLGKLTSALTVPYVLTLHTVVAHFTDGQRSALAAPLAGAAGVFVFSQQAADLLAAQFQGIVERCRIVPHGAPPELYVHSLDALRPRLGVPSDARVVSSFGLLSPGKGIEHAIAAMARLRRELDDVVLVVAGRTHPAVVQRYGESYRHGLIALARELEVDDIVIFEDWFHDVDELSTLLTASDLFVTPYTGAEQIVSGALSFAIAAGLPFVSTPYRYALEMEHAGCGLTVPFGNGEALANGLGGLLVDEPRRRAMATQAASLGAGMSWPQVGVQMSALLSEIIDEAHEGVRSA